MSIPEISKAVKWIIFCGCTLLLCFSSIASSPAGEPPLAIVSPAAGAVLDSFLTTSLRWQYPLRANGCTYAIYGWQVNLKVSDKADLSNLLVNVDLPDNQISYRLALCPQTRYTWQITPIEVVAGKRQEHPELCAKASFSTGSICNEFNASDSERYKNPREGAHWHQMAPIPEAAHEPLSPWYEIKSYADAPPPSFDTVAGRLPVPVLDGNPSAIKVYWYCWKTLFTVWSYGPSAADHQAVTNMIGLPTWGPWGSSMVWDTCFILHFARYGAQAYPFIRSLDDCYARQHENGFICREADKNNREVYSGYPVNPPLFAWAEWEWYAINKDKERLQRVLLPIVKQYEWWLRYQRRENGLYWTVGLNEADDSPRNALMYYSVSANSYQGLAAQYLTMIAHEVGREDLKEFFEAQQRELKAMVNAKFWDARHQIYNDLTRERQPITELTSGSLCKHVHMFWPLMAGFVPADRIDSMVNEIMNPNTFNRRNGVASLSADSAGYNSDTGQYWRGAVWPPAQCMLQEGLLTINREDLAHALAEKYFNACLETFGKQGTLTENLAPDKPLGCGVGNFVGWTGIGPVANLIEFILGFNLDASRNTITWTIRRTDRHGLQNLNFVGFKVDLLCQARPSSSAPCQISVTSDGAFILRLRNGAGPMVEKTIVKGTQTIQLDSTPGTQH